MSKTEQEKIDLTIEVIKEARRTFITLAAIATVAIEAFRKSAELWVELEESSTSSE